MSKPKDEPPLEYRPVFVQFVRRQRTRYNPSFSAFLDLPPEIRRSVLDKWQERHPQRKLPELKLSKPKEKRR